MLEYLKGRITQFGDNFLVIESGGMGVKVIVTRNTIEKIKSYVGVDAPDTDSTVSLLTYLHIQETKWEIFGFSEKKDREAFLLLLECRGVGTKAALNILNTFSPARLRKIALGEEPVTTLQQVQGIGAKSADRILVELKEKLVNMGGWEDKNDKTSETITEYSQEDLYRVLKNLGYRTSEIQTAISDSPTLPKTLSEAVKHMLRALSRG